MADTEVEGSDLAAILADEVRQAQTFDQSKRALAIEYMRGEMNDLPARPNGSTQTDHTVSVTISWILPGTVRVFTASDQMVQFEATQPGGEQAAEEASEYTNYSFFRENDGYRVLYNSTYDSLLMGNGAACSYWCPEESKTKLFKDKSAEELAVLLDEGWEGTGLQPVPTSLDPETGEQLYTVRLKQVTERGQIRDVTLKPENLEISGNATTIEDARYVGYLHDELTRSDLLDMADEYGWDKSLIEDAPRYNSAQTNEVKVAREGQNPSQTTSSPTVKSGDNLDAREAYIKADRDGDGIAEQLRVWCLGNGGALTILSVDEWEDDVPYTDIPCYPVPHSWQAESVYDRTADIQRVKTVLLRNMLDNAYSVALPMREVEEGSVINPDILVNPKFGGLIWKKKTSAPIINHDVAFIGDKMLMGLEYMDQQTAQRTGVSKTTMALDPETLQNQSATGTQLQHDAAYSQIELVARNMAELGWSKFFAKRRNLAKKYIKQPVQIPSRNGDMQQGTVEGQPGTQSKYRTIQPEQWSDDMACTINVGLGTGSRDRDMQMLNLIQNGQVGMAERLASLPSNTAKSKAIEFISKVRKTAVEMAESSGLKNPDEFYPDITEQEIQAIQQEVGQASQQPQDPATVKAQLDAQNKDQQAQRDHEYRMTQASSDLTMNQQKAAYENDQQMARINGELMNKRYQIDQELGLKAQQITAELALKEKVQSTVTPGGDPG